MSAVLIIRTDGGEEHLEAANIAAIRALIGADCLDSFSLRDGRTILVDDEGHSRGLPVNAKATALYRSICKPGTTFQIVGDVAIVSTGRDA